MTKQPLAEKLRPQLLTEIAGQQHLLGKEGFITRAIQAKTPLSIILWGPPGCGKTTLARLYAKAFNLHFETFSAVFSGIADLRKVIKTIEDNPLLIRGMVLFVDEIHRFNKAQQDGFLPYLEKGTFVLVGATTENPSFYLNNALLSRAHVLTLNPLTETDLEQLITTFEQKYHKLALTDEARALLIQMAQGDGRYLFNLIESLETLPKEVTITPDTLNEFLQMRMPLYDKEGEFHYNIISALHKAVRGSDPDSALYWFNRMLVGGEEPLFIARRLIRMATEDIGLADPEALKIAIAAKDAYQMLGTPEGELALAEAVVYLALAPKSNAIYKAQKQANALARETAHLAPPKIILNAPTKVMKELGYGEGYQYDHDTPIGFSGQNYFPDDLELVRFYHPVERGFEREMVKRIEYFMKLRGKAEFR